ncbi:putative leucine-rich repeat-containing protein DDB_G0290503 isoform X2 [Chironomus tepperi]|uniref:putative leucine-rich repeat-containing protein DDB_G0290503 isoform X2 n=1 Tax=Chironomus tepperi TaxID=113505 RepID=UPI00391FA676
MITGTLMSSANWITRPSNEDEPVDSSVISPAHVSNEKDVKDNNNNTSLNNEANGRSAALERAYVHEVYENCEEPAGSIRPKVAQFLAGLDPGSFVCDVGCGNGRYLTAGCNNSIYSIGVDRCCRLTKIANSSGAEVAICDNLELPFKNESFDAVLSLAVIHHFATTERRVSAIRELARVLRIGGRMIITVWALEQKSRRFESQDVLIPWQSSKTKNIATTSDDEDEDEFLPPYHAYTYTEDSIHSNSSRSQGDGDSSSLSSSSPSDTCYSFVRRALQKLAGGKKSPWFLDSWTSKDTKNDSSLDYEDAKDLPIELRRLEDFEDIPEPLSSAGLKSRSLGSILNPPPKQIVRSRSSVPSFGAEVKQSKLLNEPTQNLNMKTVLSTSIVTCQASSNIGSSRRPKLIKQKQSISDDPDLPFEENLSYKHIVHSDLRTQLLRKQSSLNEELMAESRIREKERIRKKIQKQMSLNETFLCRSVFTKRLQVIRDGFTTKIKTSTGSLERVTKNGLVKIMQNIKGSGSSGYCSNTATTNSLINQNCEINTSKNGPISRKLTTNNSCEKICLSKAIFSGDIDKMRRESGSDSSKDSSLQSDTSIESEDSFASVIYIPKKSEILSNNNKIPSVPTSPLIMPCPTPIHSPAPITNQRQFSSTTEEFTRFTFEGPKLLEKVDKQIMLPSKQTELDDNFKKPSTKLQVASCGMQTNISTIITPPTPTSLSMEKTNNSSLPIKMIPKVTREAIRDLPLIPKFKKLSSFPIVRRISSSNSNIVVPKLSSLELFNPETDDLDSDSSDEASSPDSIDSVINALQTQATNTPTEPLLQNMENTDPSYDLIPTKCENNLSAQEFISNNSNDLNDPLPVAPLIKAAADVANKLENAVEMVIREQEASSVTNEIASNIIINKNDINLNVKINSHYSNSINSCNNIPKNVISDKSGDKLESCKEHLVDFAEKLSAQLLKELDNETLNNYEHRFVSDIYSEANKVPDDPYVRKINGDIKNLSLLRDELRERRLMLANLSPQNRELSTQHDFDYSQQFSSIPPSTIQELEEDDSPPLSAKIQSHLSQNSNLISNLGSSPQTVKKQQQKISDYILEENEENEDDASSRADEDSSSRSRISFSLSYNASNNNYSNTHDTALLLQEDSFEENDNSNSFGLQHMKQNLLKTIKYPPKLNDSNNNSNSNSCESWTNSNPASLDSPSVGGGSATHHVFHHVFREGELDSLINKHVNNLHIVSSYYERASWCVVCEKVQVWTI